MDKNFPLGHIPTRRSSQIMTSLLEHSGRYEVIGEVQIEMGKAWQPRIYRNISKESVFTGEPMANHNIDSVYTFRYGDIDWGISFHFKGRRYSTKGVRGSGKRKSYGSTINMDRLYYILVNHFNNGEDFVAKFLNIVAPEVLQNELKAFADPVVGMITSMLEMGKLRQTKANRLDRRFRIVKELEQQLNNSRFSMDWIERSTQAEKALKEAFVMSMQNGTVGVHRLVDHINSPKTDALKKKLFGDSKTPFVASEQFINSIVFDLNMRLH